MTIALAMLKNGLEKLALILWMKTAGKIRSALTPAILWMLFGWVKDFNA